MRLNPFMFRSLVNGARPVHSGLASARALCASNMLTTRGFFTMNLQNRVQIPSMQLIDVPRRNFARRGGRGNGGGDSDKDYYSLLGLDRDAS